MAPDQREQEYEELFTRNVNPILAFDKASYAFLTVNDAAVRRFGYSRDELLSMTILDVLPPEVVPALIHKCSQFGNKDCRLAPIRAGRTTFRTKDGSAVEIEMICYPIPFEGKEAIFVLAM